MRTPRIFFDPSSFPPHNNFVLLGLTRLGTKQTDARPLGGSRTAPTTGGCFGCFPFPLRKSYLFRRFVAFALLLLFLPVSSTQAQDHQGWLARTYRLFQQGKLPEALQLLEQAEQSVGPHPAFFYYKGLIFQALRQPDQALQAYRQAEPALDPKYQPWLLNNLGNLFFQKGRFRTAARYYARALQKEPNYPRARFNLELALRALQQPPPPPPPPNARRQPPPPQRRESKRPPPPQPRKKDQVVAPPKRRKWGLPPANAFQLKAFDRFLPYSRVLKHHKLIAPKAR